MKINKAKLLVGTLAIAAVAATVGSISGTVAWFQYSTRATVAYQGAAAHCSESLQVRIRAETVAGKAFDNDWHTDLTASMIAAYLTDTAEHNGAGRANVNLTPVSSQALALEGVADTFYGNPIYQFSDKANWAAATATRDYIVLPLELRVLDVDGTGSAVLGDKPIYVTDLTMSARADHDSYVKASHLDFSKALRVGISAGTNPASLTKYGTFSTHGEDVKVYGPLDLNGDGKLDTTGKYEWDSGTEIVYGDSAQVAKSYSNSLVASDVKGIADDSTPSAIKGVALGNTKADGTKTLAVNLKIYLEGWQEIGGQYKGALDNLTAIEAVADPDDYDIYKATDTGKFYQFDGSDWAETTSPFGAVWDAAKGVGAEFNVGIRFSTTLHAAH